MTRYAKRPDNTQAAVEITLPWPPAVLSANSRASRFERAGAISDARLEALLLAEKNGLHLMKLPDGPLGTILTFHFPNDRRRDADNCLGMMKAALDGLCEALEIDDARLWPITLERGKNVTGGQVIVRIGNHF